MLRLEGGVWTVSSTSRSRLRSRSNPGARLMSPAPAAVPVDRLVGMGLVLPRTDRPVSGVCARVASRPFPPVLFRFAGFSLAFALGRVLVLGLALALDFSDLAAFFAVERPFGAADLFLVFLAPCLRLLGEAFLRFTAFALRAAFFAIVGSSAVTAALLDQEPLSDG